MVIVGQAGSIYIPELAPMPAGGRRLRGLRLLHTHLGAELLSREDLMDMLFLRLDAAIVLQVSENGEPVRWQGAWLVPQGSRESQDPYFVDEAKVWHQAELDFDGIWKDYEDVAAFGQAQAGSGDRAFLISVSTLPQQTQEENLLELGELARTAGLQVGGSLVQRVAHPNPRLILGKGKLAELEVQALNANADILIFDGELSPAQLHNLADITERKVLDRTQLILDIFAQHAVTRAGKLQVELAQLAYAQPRLTGKHLALDRLMGGIGGRGPGESKLETDRRKIRERMAHIKKELEKLRSQRSYARNNRRRNGIPVAALVGYTNAGKSTLLNKLTASEILTANQLFATLDPTTRRLRFPREREIALSDTVGFIRNLPKELMEAFRATLEELEGADMLVHVADAASPDFMQQMDSVQTILEDLKLLEKRRILVINKCDRLSGPALAELQSAFPDAIFVSALSGSGLDLLLARLERELFLQKIDKGDE